MACSLCRGGSNGQIGGKMRQAGMQAVRKVLIRQPVAKEMQLQRPWHG